MNNNQGGSRFFDGLIMGVIIGALAVYLFGTKSGKRLLKKISEEGFSGLEEIIENYNREQDYEPEPAAEFEEEETTQDKVAPLIIKQKKRFFKRFKRVD